MSAQDILIKLGVDKSDAEKAVKDFSETLRTELLGAASIVEVVKLAADTLVGGLRALKDFVADGIRESGAQEAAELKFVAALKLRNENTSFALDQQREWNAAAESRYAVDERVLLQMQSQALLLGVHRSELATATQAAIGLAEATGKDVGEAMQAVAKAYEGNTTALHKLGIQGANNIEMIGHLASMSATAEARAKGYEGAVFRLGDAMSDLGRDIGTIIRQNPEFIAALEIGARAVVALDAALKQEHAAEEEHGTIAEQAQARLHKRLQNQIAEETQGAQVMGDLRKAEADAQAEQNDTNKRLFEEGNAWEEKHAATLAAAYDKELAAVRKFREERKKEDKKLEEEEKAWIARVLANWKFEEDKLDAAFAHAMKATDDENKENERSLAAQEIHAKREAELRQFALNKAEQDAQRAEEIAAITASAMAGVLDRPMAQLRASIMHTPELMKELKDELLRDAIDTHAALALTEGAFTTAFQGMQNLVGGTIRRMIVDGQSLGAAVGGIFGSILEQLAQVMLSEGAALVLTGVGAPQGFALLAAGGLLEVAGAALEASSKGSAGGAGGAGGHAWRPWSGGSSGGGGGSSGAQAPSTGFGSMSAPANEVHNYYVNFDRGVVMGTPAQVGRMVEDALRASRRLRLGGSGP